MHLAAREVSYPPGHVTAADPLRMLLAFLAIESLSYHSDASTLLRRRCMMLFRQTSRSRRPKSCTPNQLTRPRNVTKTIRQILLLPLLPTSQQVMRPVTIDEGQHPKRGHNVRGRCSTIGWLGSKPSSVIRYSHGPGTITAVTLTPPPSSFLPSSSSSS